MHGDDIMNAYRFYWRHGLYAEADGETAAQAFANLQGKIGQIERFDTYEVMDTNVGAAQSIWSQARIEALEEAAAWHGSQAEICAKGRADLDHLNPEEREAWDEWKRCEDMHRECAEAIRSLGRVTCGPA